MRTHLMKLANALRKTGLSLSEALKRAWATIKLRAAMAIQPTTFSYVKEKGETRIATGYYDPNVLVAVGHFKPESPLCIRYYDTLASGWRSFRADRLIIQ